MSETTAFLAGSAVAGVAALLMLKSGGLSLSQPEVLQQYAQAPSALVTPAPIVGPTLPDNDNKESEALLRNQLDTNKSATDELKLQLEQQKFLTEQIKLQLEQQRETTAQLRSQLDEQRREATGVIDRLREQQRSMDMLTLQQALPRQEDPSLLEQAQFFQTMQNRDAASPAQVVTPPPKTIGPTPTPLRPPQRPLSPPAQRPLQSLQPLHPKRKFLQFPPVQHKPLPK